MHTSETDRQPFSPARGGRPLRGLRVLALTRVIAGPAAARLLGALGADVLRLDPPHLPELWDHHLDTGFDTRSAQVDLRDPEGMTATRALLEEADVVILGYRSEALLRFGLDPESLGVANPGLCVVSLDAWGGPGPGGARRGFDSIVQAASGIAHLYGGVHDGEWRPGALPVQALDHATGMGMAAAALALLRGREAGIAGRAHLSLARTARELLEAAAAPEAASPIPPPPLRQGRSGDGHRLEYVDPPLRWDGRPLEFAAAPAEYASAVPQWRKDQGPRPEARSLP